MSRQSLRIFSSAPCQRLRCDAHDASHLQSDSNSRMSERTAAKMGEANNGTVVVRKRQ